MQLAVSGASGKTGWRVVQEALARGHRVRALLRPGSQVPPGLEGAELVRLELEDRPALEQALRGCEALVIATGARPGPDLTAPWRVDARGVHLQVAACQAVGLQRVVLVSSLCAGLWRHPLNLFGLILVWKRRGERWLEQSGLQWTIVRPGGLQEADDDLAQRRVLFSGADQQREGSLPRRLVARVCLEALEQPASCGRIVEITSTAAPAASSSGATGLGDWLAQAA